MSARERIIQQVEELKKTLFGMDEIIKIYCLSKVADLTILLLGPHGTAKSALARLWSRTAGLNYRIVTSSEVDESLIAYIDPAVFREKNIVQMRRGELMEKDHIIVDEYFLWLNKYRAKLHQLLEEKTYAGLTSLVKTYSFLSNPLSEYYSGQIPEVNMATFDRIDLVVYVKQPTVGPTEKVARKFSVVGRDEYPLKQVVSWDDYLAARQEVLRVYVPSRVVVWLTLFAHCLASCKHVKDKWTLSISAMRKLCGSCNESTHLCSKAMLSKPRFLRATVLLAKALAWLDGRSEVTLTDVTEAITYTLPHRLVFIQSEVPLTEAPEKVKELVQEFNDEMLAWKGRGVFRKLAEFVEKARSDPPVYAKDIINAVELDVSEIHALKDFVRDTAETYREHVKDYYRIKGREQTFHSMKEAEAFLETSGLDEYERNALLFDLLENSELSYTVPKDEHHLKNLISWLSSQYTQYSQDFLMKLFSEQVVFDEDDVKIKEKLGKIVILFKNKKLKEKVVRDYFDNTGSV